MYFAPVGWVRSPRTEPEDDAWAEVLATIELDRTAFGPEALAGLEDFSHIDVVFVFDRVDPNEVTSATRHPRENPAWPEVGIFAQRGSSRPNRIGITTCELLGIDGTALQVCGLDAIDGTPVLDVKPYLTEFGPRGELRQPAWSREIMSKYW